MRADLESVAEIIESRHVDTVVGRRAADAVRRAAARLPDEELDVSDLTLLAERLTAAVRGASGDGHLYIEPARSEADDWLADWVAGGPAENWGLPECQIFPGNVGYIRLSAFFPLPPARRALGAAFSFVGETSALILDVSRNGGGDDETADAVFATLVPSAATRPFDIEFCDRVEPAGPPPERSWDDYGEARPVAVVISRYSFSAPEALAYALQQAGRATLVGRRTAGGASMLDDAIAAGDLFLVGVPTRRPLGLSSRSNWESIGVRPDVPAGDGDAEMIAWEYVRRQLADSP